jgi:hypothetical protein
MASYRPFFTENAKLEDFKLDNKFWSTLYRERSKKKQFTGFCQGRKKRFNNYPPVSEGKCGDRMVIQNNLLQK